MDFFSLSPFVDSFALSNSTRILIRSEKWFRSSAVCLTWLTSLCLFHLVFEEKHLEVCWAKSAWHISRCRFTLLGFRFSADSVFWQMTQRGRLSSVTKTSAKPKHTYILSYFLSLHLLLSSWPARPPFLAILLRPERFGFEWLKI